MFFWSITRLHPLLPLVDVTRVILSLSFVSVMWPHSTGLGPVWTFIDFSSSRSATAGPSRRSWPRGNTASGFRWDDYDCVRYVRCWTCDVYDCSSWHCRQEAVVFVVTAGANNSVFCFHVFQFSMFSFQCSTSNFQFSVFDFLPGIFHFLLSVLFSSCCQVSDTFHVCVIFLSSTYVMYFLCCVLFFSFYLLPLSFYVAVIDFLSCFVCFLFSMVSCFIVYFLFFFFSIFYRTEPYHILRYRTVPYFISVRWGTRIRRRCRD